MKNNTSMITCQDKTWFIEPYTPKGSAFCLQVKRKLHEEQTPFQFIEIYDTEHFGHLMVIDNCVMLTQYDNFFYHEMMSHTALFSHPNPKNVVIIGGGDCGTLREVLKHKTVISASQIDIDERVTRLAEQYFPELCDSNPDPRAHLHFDDGIAWMKQAAENSIDVVIIDSTDPVGPAEGLFTANFYRDCFKALTADGLLIQQTESPLYHDQLIKEVHQTLRQVGFADTSLFNFPQPCYPSGWWSATLAAKRGKPNFRLQDAQQAQLNTRYYNADIHLSAQTLPTMTKALLRDI